MLGNGATSGCERVIMERERGSGYGEGERGSGYGEGERERGSGYGEGERVVMVREREWLW